MILLRALLALCAAQEWKADGALLDQLQPAAEIDQYRMCLPKGYEAMKSPDSPAGTLAFGWRGRPREDRTTPMVTLAIVTPPEADRATPLEKFLEGMLGGIRRRRMDWTQSEVEKGSVNGLEFLRVRWTGSAQGFKMQGFMYVAKDGQRFIQLTSQDIEPHHQGGLPLSEAAVLTFSRR